MLPREDGFTIDFPRIVKEMGFSFSINRGRVDRKKIDVIDVYRVIEECDLHTLHDNLTNIVNYRIENENEVNNINKDIIKLFKLAQLSIDYLMYSQQHLLNSVELIREEFTLCAQERDQLTRELRRKEEVIKSLKKKLKERSKKIKLDSFYPEHQYVASDYGFAGVYYKCGECPKAFVSAGHLRSHRMRRHPSGLDSGPRATPTPAPRTLKELSLAPSDQNLKQEFHQNEIEGLSVHDEECVSALPPPAATPPLQDSLLPPTASLLPVASSLPAVTLSALEVQSQHYSLQQEQQLQLQLKEQLQQELHLQLQQELQQQLQEKLRQQLQQELPRQIQLELQQQLQQELQQQFQQLQNQPPILKPCSSSETQTDDGIALQSISHHEPARADLAVSSVPSAAIRATVASASSIKVAPSAVAIPVTSPSSDVSTIPASAVVSSTVIKAGAQLTARKSLDSNGVLPGNETLRTDIQFPSESEGSDSDESPSSGASGPLPRTPQSLHTSTTTPLPTFVPCQMSLSSSVGLLQNPPPLEVQTIESDSNSSSQSSPRECSTYLVRTSPSKPKSPSTPSAVALRTQLVALAEDQLRRLGVGNGLRLTDVSYEAAQRQLQQRRRLLSKGYPGVMEELRNDIERRVEEEALKRMRSDENLVLENSMSM